MYIQNACIIPTAGNRPQTTATAPASDCDPLLTSELAAFILGPCAFCVVGLLFCSWSWHLQGEKWQCIDEVKLGARTVQSLCPALGSWQLDGWWLRFSSRLPHSHLHEKKYIPLVSPAKAVMVNHNFYSTLAEILSSSSVDSPPYPPLSTE